MSAKVDKKINVLTPAAEEPITDFETVMAKIKHDGNKGYTGIENVALENKDVKKLNTDEVQP